MAEKGSQSQDFFWQHREYHSWESTEENDTTHGGSWGGAWGPPLAYGLLHTNHTNSRISNMYDTLGHVSLNIFYLTKALTNRAKTYAKI